MQLKIDFLHSRFMTRLFAIIILSLFIWTNTESLLSQTSKEYSTNYSDPFNESWRWQSYPELNGKGCRTMIQDMNGDYWFGGTGGIIHYDGLKWNFHPLSEDYLDISIVSLCESNDGSLYAGTIKGIFRFNSGVWNKLSLNLEFGDLVSYFLNKIPIICASDGSIWIGSKQGVVRIQNENTTLYQSNELFPDIDAYKKTLPQLKKFDVYSIYEDTSGNLWVGLRDGRIYTFKLDESHSYSLPQWRRVDLDNDYFTIPYPLIMKNDKGYVYIASSQFDGGINIHNGNRWRHIRLKEKFLIDEIYNDLLKLSDGRICISGLGRIFIESNNDWIMYESPTFPFASNRLILFESSDQGLWIIGLGNEVWKIDISYKNWATLLSLNFQAEDQHGNYWFIGYDGDIVKYNKADDSWTQYDQKVGVIDSPVSLLITKDGWVWIAGSDNLTAATAFFNGTEWIKQTHPNLGWIIDRRAIYESNDGSLWFGCGADYQVEKGELGGLVRYQNIDYNNPSNTNIKYFHQNEDFVLGAIYGIDQSGDGLLWVGQLGFYNYNFLEDSWQRITEPKGLDGSFVDCIDSSPNGDLWVGTRTNGIYYRNKDSIWYNFTTEDGLTSNTIIDIFIEAENSIWVSTDRDILHYDGDSWVVSIFSDYFKTFRDGISIHQTSDGSFWINQNPPIWYRKSLYDEDLSKNLVNQFKTIKYLPNSFAPETIITFSQKEISQPGNVIISWEGNDPWKSTPSSNIQFSYRIDDDPWSSFVSNTSEIFLSVSEGEHTFQVRARDMDFNVDTTPASISFYVIPPVWKQTWFIALILTFLITVVFFIYYLSHRNKIIREISETKVRLFANISHELRTPLALIIGPLSRIQESPLLDSQLLKPFDLVNKNAHRLLRLINQVLDFRKMEADQLNFEPSEDDIITFLRNEVLVFSESADQKKIKLSFDSKVDDLKMWFDFDKIERIMFNILSNALKYTHENGKINVEVTREDCNEIKAIKIEENDTLHFNCWLKIIVTDTGIGIPDTELKKIFNRFYQVGRHSKMVVGGTGIGLAVVKEMVNTHYGNIDVESKVGEGTSFIIRIPVIENFPLIETTEKELVRRQDSSRSNHQSMVHKSILIKTRNNQIINKERSKILIVEDNLEMLSFIKDELELDYIVLQALNGEEGFQKAVNENPDLILSDVMMPVMDGIQFCTKIKNDDRTSHIAMILLTARSSQEHKMEGLETGADDYLIKPFYVDELRLKINNLLESRRKFKDQFGKTLQIEPSQLNIISEDERFIQRAIEVIEENFTNYELDVENYCKLLGISRMGLYNKIKALTNLSVKEFINTIKLKRAAQLLKESGMSVTEVTYEVGFRDPSNFSKLFKKQFGISPKAYQNSF